MTRHHLLSSRRSGSRLISRLAKHNLRLNAFLRRLLVRAATDALRRRSSVQLAGTTAHLHLRCRQVTSLRGRASTNGCQGRLAYDACNFRCVLKITPFFPIPGTQTAKGDPGRSGRDVETIVVVKENPIRRRALYLARTNNAKETQRGFASAPLTYEEMRRTIVYRRCAPGVMVVVLSLRFFLFTLLLST